MTRSEPVWLTAKIIEAIHQDLLAQFGGGSGLRDRGLLESALARPQHTYAYELRADLADFAAAYGFGLARNHAFVDGNKRVALMAIYTFLALNGRELEASEADAAQTILDLAAGRLSEEKLADWIRTNAR